MKPLDLYRIMKQSDETWAIEARRCLMNIPEPYQLAIELVHGEGGDHDKFMICTADDGLAKWFESLDEEIKQRLSA